ncbi:MAG: hypothetical protein AAF353_11755 [Pseudomonadota bacterium]
MKIALVGDYGDTVVAHQAIPVALELAARALSLHVEYEWLHSTQVEIGSLCEFDGIWCVPYSPYQNANNIIATIYHARSSNIPYLGTCAGFQHAVLEFARNALGQSQAESIEDNPHTAMPLINALQCKLYDKSESIFIQSDSLAAQIFQSSETFEAYHCGFGVNAEYLALFDNTALKFSGHDSEGDPRILEIPEHRFFVATAFQPERSALGQMTHPLILAFLSAAQ